MSSKSRMSDDLSGSRPRKDKKRERQDAIAEDGDKPEDADKTGADRDLVHGDGGTVGLPTVPGDLNHDD